MRYRITCENGTITHSKYAAHAEYVARTLYCEHDFALGVSVIDTITGECLFSADADTEDDGPLADACSGSWGSNIEDQIDSGFWL